MIGLLAAQLLYLCAGLGILWALRPWSTWADALGSVGLAYLLGVAGVGVAATVLLVAGSGLGTGVVVALPLALAASGALAGWRRGHRLPVAWGVGRPGVSPASLGVAALALLTAAVLVDLGRVARNQGVVAWDAWAFWVPKAKGIYFFHGLDVAFLKTIFQPSYPMLVPALQAMDFRLIGSADVSLLALQYWFLLTAFVLAAWWLLRPVVQPVVLWPFLALATVLPELDNRMLQQQADWPLDIFFALAAICLARWLVERKGWLLVGFALLLGGALATKREGQLLAACLVAGALAATARRARTTWPWLLGAAVAAYAVNLPWRIWWTSHGLASDAPPAWIPSHADRIPSALRVVAALTFDYGLWLVAVPLALAAALLLAARLDFTIPLLYAGTTVLTVLGFVWILWAFQDFPLDTSQRTPIPREVGAIVLLSIVFAPMLLARVLKAGEPASAPPPSSAAAA